MDMCENSDGKEEGEEIVRSGWTKDRERTRNAS